MHELNVITKVNKKQYFTA